MGKKRKHSERDQDAEILKRLRKLEKKLCKRRRKSYSHSSESTSESLHHDQCDNNSEVELTNTGIPSEYDSTDDYCELSVRSAVSTRMFQQNNPGPSTTAEPTQPTPSENEKDKEAVVVIDQVIQLDDEILTLLGDAPKEECPSGKNVHSDIAKRLNEILQNGLKKETKDKLKEEYPIPGNCQLFKAPVLNPEIKAAITDILQKKDSSIAARQNQIGIALTSLTKAMDILVVDKSEINQTILKHISDACRLLCDSHYIDTKMRRNFLISTLNNKLKDTLKESKRDTNLFGESLPEKLKATKAITKTSQDLKTFKPKPTTTGKHNAASTAGGSNLNWRHPQPNTQFQNRNTTATTHRTAGNNRNETRRNETAQRRPQQPPPRARSNVPYKNQKRT